MNMIHKLFEFFLSCDCDLKILMDLSVDTLEFDY